jgi:hypothetical protein
MRLFKLIGSFAVAIFCAQVIALDTADARRGGGGGMRGGGFSGGGMRAGGAGRAGLGNAGSRGAHVSNPIARPGAGNRPGWDNRPVNRPGYGYRPGYGWGAAAALGTGLAYGAYNSGYDNSGYGAYDEGAYTEASDDPIAECARRFKTYDPASQTYIRSKGQRASCP